MARAGGEMGADGALDDRGRALELAALPALRIGHGGLVHAVLLVDVPSPRELGRLELRLPTPGQLDLLAAIRLSAEQGELLGLLALGLALPSQQDGVAPALLEGVLPGERVVVAVVAVAEGRGAVRGAEHGARARGR